MKKIMEKMSSSKEGPKLDPVTQEARRKILKELISEMSTDMLNPLKSAKAKVTVASDTKEGLKKGLEKAEEVLGEHIPGEELLEENMDDETDGGEMPEIEEKEPGDKPPHVYTSKDSTAVESGIPSKDPNESDVTKKLKALLLKKKM